LTRCAAASNPFGQPQAAHVASHLTRVCGLHHSLRLHHAPKRGKDLFRASCTGANLEDATKVKRPILQSDGLTKPASWKNEFRNTTSFLRLFLVHLFSQSPTIYSLASYQSYRPSFVKIHGFSKIKTTWRIKLKTKQSYVKWVDNTAHLTIHTIGAYSSFQHSYKGEFASDSRIKSFKKGKRCQIL
jgi:hypothetical protein